MSIEVNDAKFNNVSVNHPQIEKHIENCKAQGKDKEFARKTSGMPMEIVDKIYARGDKKK